VFISVPGDYRQTHLVFLDNEPIRADVLQERVRQKMEGATDKDIYLRGDGAVQLQELMEITDKLKAAGVQNVGIVTRLPGER
jgi:biopolymer transport protein ExbD